MLSERRNACLWLLLTICSKEEETPDRQRERNEQMEESADGEHPDFNEIPELKTDLPVCLRRLEFGGTGKALASRAPRSLTMSEPHGLSLKTLWSGV